MSFSEQQKPIRSLCVLDVLGRDLPFFYQEQFQVLNLSLLVQSETKARFSTGKFILFVNIFVFKSSVSPLNISLQLLTCSATSVISV